MKRYSGFTLIEMLIVMGIIIILMAAGIAGGRFAIQRANRIQKQSAVDNLEQALWGYYTDNRAFPRHDTLDNVFPPGDMVDAPSVLGSYMDAGAFDGGIDGTFWYFVNDERGQEFVVCAELSDVDDEVGIYCSGNGMGILSSPVNFVGLSQLPSDNIFRPGEGEYGTIHDSIRENANGSFWDGENRQFN